MNDKHSSMSVPQKYLGNKGFVGFLALLGAFLPLSTDIYLPALPIVRESLHAQEFQTNLTLSLFFIFYSLGTLAWGPLSDKYGRRPALLAGLFFYMVASFLCAVASDIYQLIFFRVLQAVGGSVVNAVTMAIVKDVYEGKKRESMLALLQSLVIIAPVVAPVFGASLMLVTSWRGVFVVLGIVGVMAFGGAIAFRETLAVKLQGNLLYTMKRPLAVLRNTRFTSVLMIFSIPAIASLAYIAASSYIYQETFRLSSQEFSYYFAFNAAVMLLGPLVYLRLAKRLARRIIINGCFAVMVVSGLLVCVFGHYSPLIFALALLPSTMAGSCLRPPSTFIMLEQQEEDTGSASALIGSFAMVMGSVGMFIVSFDIDRVLMVGALQAVLGILCGGLWLNVARERYLEAKTM
ncbi:MAG TPA: multidrug effflux MFS transporter [Patescibacteria group bacterium]|nr:multidrug effflux MFS transporter [Patescibacteria group bacterium]